MQYAELVNVRRAVDIKTGCSRYAGSRNINPQHENLLSKHDRLGIGFGLVICIGACCLPGCKGKGRKKSAVATTPKERGGATAALAAAVPSGNAFVFLDFDLAPKEMLPDKKGFLHFWAIFGVYGEPNKRLLEVFPAGKQGQIAHVDRRFYVYAPKQKYYDRTKLISLLGKAGFKRQKVNSVEVWSLGTHRNPENPEVLAVTDKMVFAGPKDTVAEVVSGNVKETYRKGEHIEQLLSKLPAKPYFVSIHKTVPNARHLERRAVAFTTLGQKKTRTMGIMLFRDEERARQFVKKANQRIREEGGGEGSNASINRDGRWVTSTMTLPIMPE